MAEIYVTSTADSGAGSLRQAIADANDGDVILFDADVFPTGQTTSILLSSYIQINKSVSIYGGASDGQGGYTSGASKEYYVYREIEGVKTKVYIDDDNPAQEGETVLFENVCRVALDGQNAGRVAMSTSRSDGVITLSGLCLQNGYVNGPAAGFYAINDTHIILTDCAIKDCIVTSNGSGIFFSNTNGNTLSGCSIANCNAGTGGGYYAGNAAVNIISDCCFDSCSATSYGGGVYSSSSSQNTLNDCTITNCSASGNGGGVFTGGASQNTLNDCTITNCSANYGGGVYARDTSKNTLNHCCFESCSAASGGGVYSTSTSQNTLTGCTIDGCSATSGGGVYSTSTSQSTLNNCTISGCTAATNGGGVCPTSTSQNTLNDCRITNCVAINYGGGVYAGTNSNITLNDCEITQNTANNGGGLCTYNSATANINNCIIKDNITTTTDQTQKDVSIISTSYGNITASEFGALRISQTATVTFVSGVTTAQTVRLLRQNATSPTITINDGAALTFTESAMIVEESVFTSSGRGYLAVLPGIDTSAATLTNVVLCAYGADVSSFAEVDGVLEWEAANPTTTVLIERADGDSWATVAQPTGESLTLYLPPSDTVRLFDGVQFFTAEAPAQRTYYYIGGSEGSFTSAADWSLRRGGVAITEPPVVAGQRFIVGDITEEEQGS